MLKDSVPAAAALVEAGVDILDVSGGLCGSRPDFLQGVEDYYIPLGASIKKETGATVLCAGGIIEAEFADRMIAYGRVDLVGIGRAMLADPEWTRKTVEWVKARSQSRPV